MVARVTTWEGGTADGLRAAAEDMRTRSAQGPPPGVKSVGITMLVDPEGSRALVIGLFENEDDLRESEAALKEMDPPEGIGTKASVAIYQVGADIRL